MKKPLILLAFALLLTGCSSHEKDIVGLWRTDSISNYVNGFSFTNNTKDAHWSYFEYKKDGSLFERRKGEYRKSAYKLISADSLVYLDSTGTVTNGYQILELNERSLVLKKAQAPYLSGKNQELYEIRYFSKATPGNKAQ
ncbi:lipoprotein [Dyadobacter sp.]|uniref:lipoprotein n=1 Tax=Dyadobacter sp. TaxID=1914288 RepID=UPI003F7250C3